MPALSARLHRVAGRAPYNVVSTEPLIVYTVDEAFLSEPMRSTMQSVAAAFGERPVHFLCATWWDLCYGDRFDRVRDCVVSHRARYPSHEFVLLCNSERELDRADAGGVQSILCNHNAFVDPRVFRPLGNEPTRPAVYDSALRRYKRHHLARRVDGVGLIFPVRRGGRQRRRIDAVRALLPSAHLFNRDARGRFRTLSAAEVNAAINECAVGLCLSQVEGAMYASVQYLLAGLPVVSTAATGGRDALFPPGATLTVEDDDRAVADAVAELAASRADGAAIRAATLALQQRHVERFVELVDRIRADAGSGATVPGSIAAAWDHVYVDKMIRWQRARVARRLARGVPAVPYAGAAAGGRLR